MTADRGRPLVVALPEPTGRPLRLGPFPSARGALKFVTYAAVGGVVATLLGPLAWVPFVAGGFVFGSYQPEGRALDRRFADYCRWQWRSRGAGAPPPEAQVRGGTIRVAGGRFLAVLATGGVPVAFLPPDDARRRFEHYRAILRSVDEGLFLRVGVEPLSHHPFLGRRAAGSTPAEGAAFAGYDELVRLLCRRRSIRRVDVYLFGRSHAPTALPKLEAQVSAVRKGLEEMGVVARRLRGRELSHAVARGGFHPVLEGPK
ncbi:MAG: hypothetical protein L3K19_02935 [Thermoplasmata archaeon]|nr:hypothetical protein [Thermoplasmata archaeon]